MVYWGLLLKAKTGEVYPANTLYTTRRQANHYGRNYVATVCPWLTPVGVHNSAGEQFPDAPRNARFLVWINGGFVKLTLKPGETRSWGFYCRTEEGYHAEGHTWTHEGDRVTYEHNSDGRDCDGRLSHGVTDACPIDDLKARPVTERKMVSNYAWHDVPTGEFRPDWKEASRAPVYDEFARRAGY